jgi:hypothetical protein
MVTEEKKRCPQKLKTRRGVLAKSWREEEREGRIVTKLSRRGEMWFGESQNGLVAGLLSYREWRRGEGEYSRMKWALDVSE